MPNRRKEYSLDVDYAAFMIAGATGLRAAA